VYKLHVFRMVAGEVGGPRIVAHEVGELPAYSATEIKDVQGTAEVYTMVSGKDCDRQIGAKPAMIILQQRLRARSPHEMVGRDWKVDERRLFQRHMKSAYERLDEMPRG
jgi:hypothetical protein